VNVIPAALSLVQTNRVQPPSDGFLAALKASRTKAGHQHPQTHIISPWHCRQQLLSFVLRQANSDSSVGLKVFGR